jgi:type IV secretory pathway protease TraF
MLAFILAAVMAAHGTPVRVVDQTVVIEGRPQCIAQALYGDPTRPVVVCR